MADTRLKIAVFIDFDNIEIGVKSTLGVQFDIGIVLEALKERGDVVSKIAYGDWTRAGDYSRSLTQHATKLVQRNLTPGGDKNGADINLALDALEMAFTHSHINAYVIVGGDSDFITLVEKLKQYDKQIFVVGGRSFTSLVMQRNCHEFIAYENLGGGSRRAQERGRQGQAAPPAQAPIEQAVPLVRRALKVLTDREVSPQLGLLKSTLLQLDSTFSERTYGVGSFRDFAQKLAAAGYVSLRENGRNVLVELSENGHGSVEGGRHQQSSRASERAADRAAEPDVEAPSAPAHGGPRAADGIREVRRLFQSAQNPPRWPMYVRQAKQFLRNVDPTFDERKFGFGSLVDLLRACQRDGLFRLERDRQGVIRLFPGNVMQPAGDLDREPIEEAQPFVEEGAPSLEPAAAEPVWESAVEPVFQDPAPDIVDGDVVQEMEVPEAVDGIEAAGEAEAPRKTRGRGRSRSSGESRGARKHGGEAARRQKQEAGEGRSAVGPGPPELHESTCYDGQASSSSSNGSSGSSCGSAGSTRLWTLTPRSRTGLSPASVFFNNATARAAISSGFRVGGSRVFERVIVVKSE